MDALPLTEGPLKIKVVTWNLGDSKLTQTEWTDEVAKSWSIVTAQDYDILCLALQEDSSGKYGKLGDSIAAYLDGDFVVNSNIVNGPPELSGRSYTVKAYIFTRRNKLFSRAVKKNDTCLMRKIFCTKSSAGIALTFLHNRSTYQLIFIASHLPINTSKEDLGYEERIKAVQKTFNEVYDKLVDLNVAKRVSFWAGDLNFRDNTPIHKGGNPFNQLEYAFSTRKAGFWRDFQEPEVEFPPTCKMKSCDKKSCPACRYASGDKYNETCYITEHKGGERQPSHCDRILYNTVDVDGDVLEYKSWGKAESVQKSDHNVVYAVFSVL